MPDYLKKFSLDKKVVFVCGGTGLIGSEVSRALAGAGAKTVILDVDRKKGQALERGIREAGCQACFEYFDATRLQGMEKEIKKLLVKYKRIDAWVNAAYPRTKDWGSSLEDLKIESLRQNIDMHLNSYSWISRLVALAMKKQKTAGSVINFGSIYGVQANDFTLYQGTDIKAPMAYSMIKGGIVNVTRYLASYFGKDNIRFNCVCPGGIFDRQNKKFVRQYENKVPLKRMGAPQDVAAAVLYLACDASCYVTGTTFMVDGGWTIV